MAKKSRKLGVTSALAVGAGAAVLMAKKAKENEKKEGFNIYAADNGYRNTERGKNARNSKGIYYSNGNYEAFARPEKPEGVEEKNA